MWNLLQAGVPLGGKATTIRPDALTGRQGQGSQAVQFIPPAVVIQRLSPEEFDARNKVLTDSGLTLQQAQAAKEQLNPSKPPLEPKPMAVATAATGCKPEADVAEGDRQIVGGQRQQWTVDVD